MPWPVSQDYNEAVQNPGTSFADDDLSQAAAVTNALGLPIPRSGNFADVYEFTRGDARWAVKCFTRPVQGLAERYDAISRGLHEARLPFSIEFKYLRQGVRVRGDWYPVLKMEWVEGFLLNQFVRDNLERPAVLDALCQIWVRMARRLRQAEVTHGDLQHGNVLLVPGSKATSLAVRLIDYDGLWVPELAGVPSGEVGHPSYQHPQRLREGTYGPEVDRFPLLVVATALRGLIAGGPALWERYDNGDNLLFRETDLRDPAGSALFRELWELPDSQAHALVGHLVDACGQPVEQVPLLDDVMSEDAVRLLPPARELWVAATLGALADVTPSAAAGRGAGARAAGEPVGTGEAAEVVALAEPAPSARGRGWDAEPGGEPEADFGSFDFGEKEVVSRRSRGRRRRLSATALAWIWVAVVFLALAAVLPLVLRRSAAASSGRAPDAGPGKVDGDGP